MINSKKYLHKHISLTLPSLVWDNNKQKKSDKQKNTLKEKTVWQVCWLRIDDKKILFIAFHHYKVGTSYYTYWKNWDSTDDSKHYENRCTIPRSRCWYINIIVFNIVHHINIIFICLFVIIFIDVDDINNLQSFKFFNNIL